MITLAKWERNLVNRSKLWAGQVVPVHAISNFVFCRRDPERFLEHLQKGATFGMLNGTKNHEELENACVPIKIRQTIRAINGTIPISFREFLLVAKHKGFVIAGSLDEISFVKGRPVRLMDDKFPESLRNFESLPYPSQEAQLLLYAFLLERTGFNIKDLKIFLVKHYHGQEKEFEVFYDKQKVGDILTSCAIVQKLYYSVLPKS